jgi:hypothetical protein
MKKTLSERDNGKTNVPLNIPRLLKKQQAAAYCGVSIPTFAAVCPVTPIALGVGKRLERYDIRDLDEWIERLKGNCSDEAKDWLSLLR